MAAQTNPLTIDQKKNLSIPTLNNDNSVKGK
jgi:hypothetical protein